MAAVTVPRNPLPSHSAPSSPIDKSDNNNNPSNDQLYQIKYSITTTPPQPTRSIKPPTTAHSHHSDLHDPLSTASNSNEFDKEKAMHSEEEEHKNVKHEAEKEKHDYTHEELHPTLLFIPEDKEHPPKPIVRNQQRPASSLAAFTVSPTPSPVSSPAPANSPSSSPQAGPRRLSQRQQKKALRASQASHDDGEVDRSGAPPSKLRLLAPPPINSRRGSGNGLSRSPSPTPSPSPPPSPYLSPTHPKRRGSFSSTINSFIPVQELMAELTPSKVGHHPYVLYPGLFITSLLLALTILRIPFSAPVSAFFLGLRYGFAHPSLFFPLVAAVVVGLGVMYKKAIYEMYKSAFLPPAGSLLPRPFKVEDIDLTEEKWQKMIPKWAEQIDANSTIVEVPIPSAATPLTPNPNGTEPPEGAVSFDGISGANALALMECYQRGQLEDCRFHCLRIYLSDPSLNTTGDGDDTVAITFLSIKEHYDLSPYLLRLFTPIQACFPFLCAPALLSHTIRSWMSFRFCVIGFHWPFRQCVVFTKPLNAFKSYLQLDNAKLSALTSSTDPRLQVHVARYTAVLQLVQQFDAQQPKGQRSDFMLFPVLSSSCVVDAITAAGGAALPILPTYVVDLRKFKGGEWQDYKRHLRKLNRKVREGPFEGAGGNTELTEGADVTEEQAKTLVSLWHQVADYRGAKDQTVCMMEPNPTYVQALAHHRSKFIQMLALKLKDTTVAASLLFSLSPTLMTSDVAGFNYPALEAAGKEANQQIKAYPVKLAAVLKVAIQNGYEWVDFGPTTGTSKMEIGAKEMPITAGLFYHGAVTSVLVKVIATCLSKQHTVAKKAYD